MSANNMTEAAMAPPEDGGVAQLNADTTTIFVLNSAYLVFFMHCGFAMISIGCVRARFAKHIALLILVDACASALGFFLFGYAFAWGDHTNADGVVTQNAFIGSKYFGMHSLVHSAAPNNPAYYLWVFQWSFAATACTIVSGAIAERAKFETYILYSFFMAAWVYPVLTHSVWSPAGWAGMLKTNGTPLLGVGAIDYAGSGAVHMVGGLAAATGCWIIGPRIGRFLPDGTVVDMPGHNTSLFVLGVMILWFGWYGFNPGSQLAVYGYGAAIANAAVTTTIAPASAGMSALFMRSFLTRGKAGGRMTYDVGVMGNGALAGLVAITAGCSTIYPWGAVIVGGVAGVLYVCGSYVSVLLHLDDPLDAIAVHLWNGTWGVIAVGFLAGKGLIAQAYGYDANDNFRQWGCWLGGNGKLLGAQIIYALWLLGWVGGNMIPFWYLLKLVGHLRVPANEETVGLDDSYHGGTAYPGHGADDFLDKSGRNGKAMNGNTNGNLSEHEQTQEIAQLRNEIEAIKKSMTKSP